MEKNFLEQTKFLIVKHGIANISVIPVRKEPAEQSEMHTQLLLGEHFEIINTIEKWAQVRLAYDNYKGWIDYKMIYFISEDLFEQLEQIKPVVTTEHYNYISQPKKKSRTKKETHSSARKDFHHLTMKKKYIHQIRSGEKTVEGRVSKGAILKYCPGDKIRFYYYSNASDDVT